MHWKTGLPLYPEGQEQRGACAITEHWAFGAHEPGHGSLHFLLIHAKWDEQSSFTTHSGRQFGGDPTYSGTQEHDGISPFTWQIAFGPHGEGTHGLEGGASGGAAAVNIILFNQNNPFQLIHLNENTYE